MDGFVVYILLPLSIAAAAALRSGRAVRAEWREEGVVQQRGEQRAEEGVVEGGVGEEVIEVGEAEGGGGGEEGGEGVGRRWLAWVVWLGGEVAVREDGAEGGMGIGMGRRVVGERM